MIWVLRLFGYPVLTFGPESLVDERTDGGCISHTSGQFELATEDYSPDYDEECPEETNGFGFRRR